MKKIKREVFAALVLLLLISCEEFSPTDTNTYRYELISFSQLPTQIDTNYYFHQTFGNIDFGETSAKVAADSIFSKLSSESVTIDTAWVQSGERHCGNLTVIVFPQLLIKPVNGSSEKLSTLGFARVKNDFNFNDCDNISFWRYSTK